MDSKSDIQRESEYTESGENAATDTDSNGNVSLEQITDNIQEHCSNYELPELIAPSTSAANLPPDISLASQLVSHNPTILLHYIQFLQDRVREMEVDRQLLRMENEHLRVNLEVAEQRRAVNEYISPEATPGPSSASASQVHIIARDSNLIRNANAFALTTTPTTSTPVLALFTRNNGQEDVHLLPTCSSHSIVTIRPPTFLSSQNSIASILECCIHDDDLECPPDIILNNQAEIPETNIHATRSTPNVEIDGTNSNCNMDVERSEDRIGIRIGSRFFPHVRHSWPSILDNTVLGKYTAVFADLVNEMMPSSSSESDSGNSNRSWTTATTDSGTVHSITSSSAAEYPASEYSSNRSSDASEDLLEAELDRLFLENESPPNVPSRPVIPLSELDFITVLEHPFQAGLRTFQDNFRVTMRVGAEPIIPTGHRLAPRPHISMANALRANDTEDAFMARLRSQLYYNVNLFAQDLDMISPADQAGSEHYLDFITDDSPGGSGTNFFEGELVDEFAANFNLDEIESEEMLLEAEVDSDSESSQSSDSGTAGQGDADLTNIVASVSSSSSSADSVNPTATRLTTGHWTLPSHTYIGGGKYDYLRVTDRPRPYHGHRFVISVFGTNKRRENEARLPSWVPTYAQRLECILNQYISPKSYNASAGSTRNGGVSTKHVHMSSEIAAVEADSSELFYACLMRRNTSSIKRLKSCLKTSRESSIGESATKVISWSDKIAVLEDQCPSGIPSQEDLLNSNAAAQTDPVLKTKSCPGMFCKTDKNATIGTQNQPTATFKRIPIQAIDLETARSKKKKRSFKAIVKRVCICHHCTRGATVSAASSLASNEPDTSCIVHESYL